MAPARERPPVVPAAFLQWWRDRKISLWLFWTIPLTIVGTNWFDAVFPYQLDERARGAFGFPFAYGAWTGASSNSNIISLAPFVIDIALVGAILHTIGWALRTHVPLPIRIPVTLLVALVSWPQVMFFIAWTWTGNWGWNWWSLGQLPVH